MPKPKLESPSKDSEPKTEFQTEPSRKTSSIVILDGEEIEEFWRKQVAKNSVKRTESAVRRLRFKRGTTIDMARHWS